MMGGVGKRVSFAMLLLALTAAGCVTPISADGITLLGPDRSMDLPVAHHVTLAKGSGVVVLDVGNVSRVVGFVQHGAAAASAEGPSIDIVLVGLNGSFFPEPRELRSQAIDGGRPLFVNAPGASASRSLVNEPYGGFGNFAFAVDHDEPSLALVVFWANLSASVELETYWGEGTIVAHQFAEASRIRAHEFASGVGVGASVAATGMVNSGFTTGLDGVRQIFLAKLAGPFIGGPTIRLTDDDGTRELETDPRPFAYTRLLFTTAGRTVVEVDEVSLGDSELSFQYAALPIGAPSHFHSAR